MKIIITRQELQAALLFASTDGTRYILTGVNIEVRPHKPPVLVATDGRRLVAIETVAEQIEDLDEEHSININPDFIDVFVRLSKACGGKLKPWLVIENNPGSKRVKVEVYGGQVGLDVDSGALIDGQYPMWRRVLPAKSKNRQPIAEIGLNAEFVGDFAKAAKILECESPLVQMNLVGKESQVEVKIKGLPSFYGLLMQCKLDESIEYQPEFVHIVEGLATESEQENKAA